MRLGACFGLPVEIIEPCGFVWNDKRLRRAGMDYATKVTLTRHQTWEAFVNYSKHEKGRLILFTTKSEQNYTSFTYKAGDSLIFGQESGGVPNTVHHTVEHRVCIPLVSGARSLNLAQAAAIGSAEAIRQLNGLSSERNEYEPS